MNQPKTKPVTVFSRLCKGCGMCVVKCPVKAISFSKSTNGYLSTPSVVIDNQKCIACGLCELFCPDCAIRVDKKPV